MTKRKVVVEFVSVAPSLARLRQIAGLFEVADDLGRSSLRDPYGRRDVSQSDRGLNGDALEHVRVVGDEPPLMVAFSRT